MLKCTWLQPTWVIFFFEVSLLLNTTWWLVCAGQRYNYRSRYPTPKFLTRNMNVTFRVGETATLNCSVADLGTRTVVWQKLPDRVTLTIGKLIFVSDANIKVDHDPDKHSWNLQIENVQLGYTGKYECQVSSSDKTLRQVVYLKVKEAGPGPSTPTFDPVISMYAPSHVNKGETLEIRCNATGADQNQNDELDWFLDGYKIVTDKDKGVYISKTVSLASRTISSTLTIQRATLAHGGRYTCRTSAEQILTKHVEVLTADNINRDIRDQDKGQEEKEKEEHTQISITLGNKHSNSQRLSGCFQCILLALVTFTFLTVKL